MVAMMIVWGVLVILLVGVAAVVPVRSRHTEYQRAQAAKKTTISLDNRREAALVAVMSLQRIVSNVLLLISSFAAVAAWGWGVGILVSLIVAVVHGLIAALEGVSRIAGRLYARYEVVVLGVAERYGGALKVPFVALDAVTAVTSRDELEHSIETLSKTVVTADERAALLHGLQFKEQQVYSLMVPLADMRSVKKSELLGPFVLDDLHKTGQRRFAVVDDKTSEVVGILDIRTLLQVRAGQSQTAGEAMQQSMYFIHQNESLERALALCLGAHDSLLLVVNDVADVVGVLLLDDIISKLTGRVMQQSPDHYDSPNAALRMYKKGEK